MMWKARQLNFAGFAIAALGKNNAQNSRSPSGISAKGFVKVAHPKKQYSIRILRLETVKLFHHWSLSIGGIRFCHGPFNGHPFEVYFY